MKGKASQSQYYRRLGLGGDPFPITGIDNVLYLTPELEKRLKRIWDRVHDGVRLIIVSAPRGAGKSRLSHHLEATSHGRWQPVRIPAREGMGETDLALALLAQLSPETNDNPGNTVNHLREFLEQEGNNNHIPVIIIDDAHCLPADTLRYVFELTRVRHGESALRFVLFAEDSIDDLLPEVDAASPAGEYIHNIRLPALTESQTSEYIRHRILSYGHIRNDPFDEDTIRHIYYGSGGLPGSINYLARQAVQASPSVGMGGKAIAAVILLLFGVAGYLFIPGTGTPGTADLPGGSSPGSTDTAALTTETRPDPASSSVPTVNEVTPPTTTTPDHKNVATESDSLISTPETIKVAETIREETPATKASGSNQPPAPEPQPAIPERQTRTGESPIQEENEEASNRTTAITPESSPSPLTQAEEPAAPASPQQPHVFDLEGPREWTRKIRGEDWLRSRPRDSALLQIISAGELENVKRLVTGLPELPEELSGFTNYTPSGQPRYRLYYGLYPDSKTAADAVSGLPERLRSLQPWPRPLNDIIKELDEKKKRFPETQ